MSELEKLAEEQGFIVAKDRVEMIKILEKDFDLKIITNSIHHYEPIKEDGYLYIFAQLHGNQGPQVKRCIGRVKKPERY